MNKSLNEWNTSAERFDSFKENDLAWKYILYPLINSLDVTIKNQNIIDIGCGNGALIDILYEEANSITAIDFSSKMIEIANLNYKDCPKIRFIKEDITDLKVLVDSSFDILYCLNVLVDIRNVEQSIKNISNLVKQKGVAIIAIEHPFYTSKIQRAIDKTVGKDKVERNYFNEFSFVSYFLGENHPITGWHRPLSKYFELFKLYHLNVIEYHEPKPTEMIDELGLFHEEPLFALFILEKQ